MSTRGTTTGFTVEELEALTNAPVYTSDGEKFGLVGEFWYDEGTNVARYLKIGRGPLGMRAVCVPLAGATRTSDGIQLPYTKDQLEESPEWGGDSDLEWTDEREREIGRYYGTATPATEDADMAVTRHEEELHVGKEAEQAGRARLRKWVEAEPVDMDVDLRRETARVTRERIDEPVRGAQIGEQEIEVPLHEERAVVEKQVVAKERIGLEKDVETQTERVTDEVRKERVDIDEDRR